MTSIPMKIDLNRNDQCWDSHEGLETSPPWALFDKGSDKTSDKGSDKVRGYLARFALVGFAMTLLSGCKPGVSEPPQAASPPVAAGVVQPKRGPSIRYVTLPGEIKAYHQATLYAKVAGYLKTISVDKGEWAKE